MANASNILDTGKVRIGAGVRAPKASVADKGTVRIGAGVRRA